MIIYWPRGLDRFCTTKKHNPKPHKAHSTSSTRERKVHNWVRRVCKRLLNENEVGGISMSIKRAMVYVRQSSNVGTQKSGSPPPLHVTEQLTSSVPHLVYWANAMTMPADFNTSDYAAYFLDSLKTLEKEYIFTEITNSIVFYPWNPGISILEHIIASWYFLFLDISST